MSVFKFKFKYSSWDFCFTCLGLLFLLLDIGLDVFAVVSFYKEEAYVSLCILVLFLVGSSVLVQAFSWLWYSYSDFKRGTTVEKCLSEWQLKLLHVLQLGIYFRHAGVVECSVKSFFTDPSDVEGFAVYLSHDLSLLRLIETFSESAPQLVLMGTIMLQQGDVGPVTVLKAIGSASAIAFSVTTYHRAMRSFLPYKEKQQIVSSLFYFFWNLLLISSRLTALALFASVLPCFVFAHFFCSWLVLFFFAWRCKTDLMESVGGEWLYRATVGLIWYFDWFNVVVGRTRKRTLLYHAYVLVDISFLCSLWFWKKRTDIQLLHAVAVAVGVVAVYILGLFFKMIYYKCYHPNLAKVDATEKSQSGHGPTRTKPLYGDETDFPVHAQMLIVKHSADDIAQPEDMMHSETDVEDRSFPVPTATDSNRSNKRMRKLAESFYS